MIPITVVIPTHRRPRLLAEAMASVLAQRDLPTELIVVDDADDPATRAMVARIAAGATAPIRYLVPDGAGVCHSRNAGMRASATDWVAFLDDDDVWHAHFLHHVGQCVRHTAPDFVMSGIVRHERGAAPVVRIQPAGLASATVFGQPASMTGSNLLVRRDALLRVGGFDPAMTVFNDWDLFVRLVDAGMRYAVVPDALAEWRDHAGPRIATPSLKRADGIARFLHRYRHRLSPRQVRELSTTELGIRRAHAASRGERLATTARLAMAHGISGTIRQVSRRMLGRRIPSPLHHQPSTSG